MRYRKPASQSVDWGQVATPAPLARLVARYADPLLESILELGAGDGTLLAPILSRVPAASAVAVDIDASTLLRLQRARLAARIHQADVLDSDQLACTLGAQQFDAVVGNPPFAMHQLSQERAASLRAQFGASPFAGRWVRDDLVFFLESWKRLKAGGQALFILPAPLLTARAYEPFRAWLLGQTSSLTVIELEPHTFAPYEVQSYLLCARRRHRCSTVRRVALRRANAAMRVEAGLTIEPDAAVKRMDLRFHEIVEQFALDAITTLSLGSIGADVRRGSRSHSQFEQLGQQHVHTTDFAEPTSRFRFPANQVADVNVACCGDLLVPRVGTRCLLRQAIVISGASPYTEAVYRIRAPSKWHAAILNTLQSEAGQMWRRLHARGSCAQHLTVGDLLAMPLATSNRTT